MLRIILAATLLLSLPLYGCGLDWSLPYGRFSHVNEFGEVSFWEKLDDVKLSENLTIPLNINFNSNRGTSSAVLGNGWIFALFDTYVYALDEGHFVQYDPSGRFRNFWRNNAHENIISNPDGWKGEIDGDTIKLYADCGWKLVYKSGRISSISTPDGQTLSYQFKSGGDLNVYKGGELLIQVISSEDGVKKQIKYDDKVLDVTLGDRPNVKLSNGAGYVVDGILKSLTLLKGGRYEREFSYDVNDGILPRLVVDSNSPNPLKLTWDPAKRNQIVDDGLWKYAVEGNDFPRKASTIERYATNGESEFLKFDIDQQTETYKSADGFKIVRQQIGLKNAESYRAITRELPVQQLQISQRNSFKETGELYRTVKRINNDTESIAEFKRNETGELVKVIVDGKIIWEK